MDRGTGTTTRQMEAAPNGTVFVWVHAEISYPKALAHKIGRDDLEIVGPDWLENDRWRGRTLTGVVVDHAAILTGAQWDGLDGARSRSSARP
jgi:hypothetical protein